MASSPPYPYPLNLPNPRKRQSFGGQSSTSQPASKRPKMHQLSITSFPTANESHDPGSALYTPIGRSARSETGSVAHSAISTTSSKVPGRGRGRPRKSAQIHVEDTQPSQGNARDGESQVHGGRIRGGTKSVISTKSAQEAEEEDDEEELENIQPLTEAEEDERDHQRLMRLKAVFDDAQNMRHEIWRASRLDPKTMRTLVNQACSQSVTKNPLAAVHIYSKFFAGELLERAREVQTELAEAYDATRVVEKVDRQKELELAEKQLDVATEEGDVQQVIKMKKRIEKKRKEAEEYIPNPHRGGLMPDHLREAWRRYRADGDGTAGVGGWSHGLLGDQGVYTVRRGEAEAPTRLFR